MSKVTPAPPPIEGLRLLAERYDGFIVDLWGVLHDGIRPYDGAVRCLAELRGRDKRIVILSNAPRRAAEVARRTAELGIGPQLYDALMSSGEEAWRCLKDRPDPWYRRLGRAVYCMMAARDRGMLAGLELRPVERIDRAEFVLALGVDGPGDGLADYEAALAAAVARRLPMVCANPDLEVVRGGVREICAGALARRYEELGGAVRYHGKPYPSVYESCLALLGRPARGRVLAIGDSLSTDVAGATGVGLDSLLVAGGIHAEEFAAPGGGPPDARRIAAACRRAGQRPTAVIAQLLW